MFEARPDARALTTVTFAEAHGRTTLARLVEYANKPDRDAHSQYMHDGLQDAMRLFEQTVLACAT